MPVDFLDLIGQAAERPSGPPEAAHARLRQTHHLLARKLAEGASPAEASALTGFSPSWIGRLKQDPAFRELLEYYKAQTETLLIDWEARLAALGGAFLDEIQHRLETQPEKFTDDQLRKMAETFLDRSVAPSKSKAGQAVPPGAGVAIKIDFVGRPPEQGRPFLDLEAAE